MNIVPKGTGRYLLAQLAAVWLWFCFYFIYLLLASLLVRGLGISFGGILYMLWIALNLGGFMAIRAIAHSTGRESEWQKMQAAQTGEFVADMAISLMDEDAILYDPSSQMNEKVRRTLLSVGLLLIWALYAGLGFVVCATIAHVSDIASGVGNPVRFLDQGIHCWSRMPGLRIYVMGGGFLCAHLLAYMHIRPVRTRFDRFVLGPWYAVSRKISARNRVNKGLST